MSDVFISLGIVLPEARNGIWRALVFLRRYRVPRFSSILSERCRVFACCVPPEALATGYVPHASREENRTPGPKKGVSAHGLYEVSLNRRHYYDVISLLLYFLCAAKKKEDRPTERRTEIIQLHSAYVILISRARSGFAPFLAAAPSPGIKLWCPVHDRLSQQRTPLPGRRERWVRNAHARLNGMARRKGHREERLRTRETHTRQKASGELRHRSGCKV